MRINIFIMTMILVYGCGGKSNNDSANSTDKEKTDSTTYKIILKSYNLEPMGENDSIELPGNIETNTVKRLSEPLKGLTAFYSAMGGSYCNNITCDLTTALGLGKQGSDQHKSLIKKYLPDDSVAEFLIKQDCYLRPDGASSFNSYEYLTLIVLGDTVKVDYCLYYFSRGKESFNRELDIYLYRNDVFKKVKRNDEWTYTEK